ncbi:phosphatidylserine/phosphatidylglycerophosphate/cardiolipin synthase family protein [Nostoc sp. T09]|uniref:phospholipase D-like domain-containing protein n=1 Tax=Nostoc sp. T09 TaxID=1932621 RepID=UPI00211B423A|nr:phospholipase D-like domain-containing protein [Nostoc sp. T09]
MNIEFLRGLTWLSSELLLVLIFILLFILYLTGAFHKKINYRITDVPGLTEPDFPVAMMSVSNSLITQGEFTNFWFEIEDIYTARLEAIQRAQSTIHFETFFMTPGRRADEFAAALAERSQAGVEVLFIADSLGVTTISQDYWQKLKAAGVAVRFFHEFTWKAPLAYNIRTHRKLLLIDGEVAFVGGMGVSDHWDGVQKKEVTDPWLDLEVCFTGQIVVTLEGIFMQHWLYEGGVASLRPKLFKSPVMGGATVLVTPSSSPAASSTVCALFYTTFLAATQRIWLASPYFLPDHNARQALLAAKKRGIDVRILTMGFHNDKKLIYYAVREGYAKLLAAGIEIYEHQPSMMHAKVLLIDDNFVSTGSTNLDPRSLFHNDELQLSLSESELAQLVEQFFAYGISRSDRITITEWKARPIWQRVLGWLTLFFRWQL